MIAAFLSLLAIAGGQTPPVAAPPAPSPEVATQGDPDVLISVRAHADEVRWRQVGTVTVRAWSEPGGRILDENLSTGLPRPIPGQRTFRDVNWSLRAGACFADPRAEESDAPAGAACPTPAIPHSNGEDPR